MNNNNYIIILYLSMNFCINTQMEMPWKIHSDFTTLNNRCDKKKRNEKII